MESVLINRRRLMVGDIFTLPNDEKRYLHLVAGNDLTKGLLIRCVSGGWYGYLDVGSGIVVGSRDGEEWSTVANIPEAVHMRECDVR